MPSFDILKQITDVSVFKGIRSNILGTLLWLFAISAFMTGMQNMFGKSFAITVTFMVVTVLSAIGIGVAYVCAFRKDPNWLRTERYNIQKQLIDRGLIRGDSEAGLKVTDENTAIVNEVVEVKASLPGSENE